MTTPRWCLKCESKRRWAAPIPYCPLCVRVLPDAEIVAAYVQHCPGDNPLLQMAKWLPEDWTRPRFISAVSLSLIMGLMGEDEFYQRHPGYDNRSY